MYLMNLPGSLRAATAQFSPQIALSLSLFVSLPISHCFYFDVCDVTDCLSLCILRMYFGVPGLAHYPSSYLSTDRGGPLTPPYEKVKGFPPALYL